jgi:hypothetical protein
MIGAMQELEGNAELKQEYVTQIAIDAMQCFPTNPVCHVHNLAMEEWELMFFLQLKDGESK